MNVKTRIIAAAEALLLAFSVLPFRIQALPGDDAENVRDGVRTYEAGVPSSLPEGMPVTSNKQIEGLIAAAEGELGYAAQGGWTKYGAWYAPGLEYGAWCAMFVAWCADQAGIPTNIIAKQSTVDIPFYAKNATVHYFFDPWLNSENQNVLRQYGIRCSRTEYTPQRGDLIFIHWDWPYENMTTTFSHIGIVCGVWNNRVYTIEGNSGTGVVRYKYYDLTDQQILCYATPNYERDIYATGYYAVTSASGLNLRSAPASNASPLRVIPHEAELRVSEVSGDWGKVEYLGTEGWISLRYVRFLRPVLAESIELPPAIVVEEGCTVPFPCEIAPEDTTVEMLACISSDPEIFTAANGILTAKSVGKAKLTVSLDGVSDSAEVVVLPKTAPLTPSPWLTVLPDPEPGAIRTTEEAPLFRTRTRYALAEEDPDPEEYLVTETEYLYGEYGEEKTTTEEITETDTVRIVSQTKYYVYFHYHNVYNGGDMVDSIEYGKSVGYDEVTLNYELEKSSLHDMGEQQAYRHRGDPLCDFPDFWFLKETYVETVYQERDRTEVNHRFYDTGWTEWTEGEVPEELPEHTALETGVFQRYTDNRVSSITLLTPPDKLAYQAREKIDLTGLTFTALMSDGSDADLSLSDLTVTGYDENLEGEQTVCVGCGSASASFVITVTDPAPTRLVGGSASGLWNDTVTVTVKLADCRGLRKGVFSLGYDEKALSLLSMTPGSLNGITLNANDKTVTLDLTREITADTELFTLSFRILRSAEIGAHEVTLTPKEGSLLRADGKPLRVLTEPARITVEKETAHRETSTVTKKATCTEEGIITYYCTVCEETRTEVIPKSGHTMTEERTEPTCNQEGSVTRTCSVCGHVETETLPKSEHHYECVTTEPDCTHAGKHVYTCPDCGESYEEAIPALGHDYADTVIPPTKKDGGYTVHTCTRCGDSFTDTETPPLGYTVSFLLPDGTVTDRKTLFYGDPVKVPAAPTKAPTAEYTYTFTGWDGWKEGMTVTGDLTFTAVFSKTKNSYRVRFLMEDGTVLNDETLPYGTRVTPPASPSIPATTRYSYEFLGWKGYSEGMTVTGARDFTAEFKVTVLIPDRLTSDVYKIEGGFVRKLSAGTTVGDLKKNVNGGEFVTVYRDGMKQSDETVLGSGMKVVLGTENETVETLTVTVTGDVNGDGKITLTDYVRMKANILNGTDLGAGCTEAGDLNGDGKLTLTDYVRMKAFILNGTAFDPN